MARKLVLIILLLESDVSGIYKRLAMKKKLLEKIIIIKISYLP